VLSVPDGRVTGVAKGESLADIGEMFNSYGDLVVMRHPQTDAVEAIQRNLVRPLINAGNGTGEHPTQALLDWYCLMKWKPAISLGTLRSDQRLHVGIVGTPGSMRAVKSFLRMALLFEDSVRRITVVSESDDPISPDLRPALDASQVEVECIGDLREVLPELDVVYINSIALLEGSYELLDRRFVLRRDSPLKKGAAILHPLARRDELAQDLDETEHNLYFAQAAGAVYLRQALLISILDRVKALPTSVLYLTS